MALPDSCPLCGAIAAQQNVVTPHVYGSPAVNRAFFHCSDCDVRYLYPRLNQDEERQFYAAEFEGFMVGRAGGGGWTKAEEHIRINESTRTRRMAYLEPYLRSPT